ncbi:MAG: radical SAM protein [Candidatus Omnitrophica bacterium]|nr:radical SAM protein [Candidatus Omnitrophota bacterium]
MNSSKVDILFVNQPSPDKDWIIRDINRSGRKTREHMIWPQTNLAWEAAVMRDAGFTVQIIDSVASRLSWEELELRVQDLKPRYVVANVISTTLNNDMRLFFYAKAQGSITIAHGPHITDKPLESLRDFPCVDYCVMNEAEEALRELILEIEKGTGDLGHILGIAWRRGTEPVRNGKRPFIADLDSLPSPAYELLPLDKYYMPFFGNYVFIEGGRGCPYRCIYCRQTVMWESRVRNRSAEILFKEVKQLHDLGMKHVMFHHDTFTADRRMVMRLCELIIESGLKIKWCCNTHVARVDEELVGMMKKAGCWMIAPGFETADQTILDNVQKRATVEQNIRAAHMIHNAGIEVWGYFMFGNPGETHETIRRTIDMAKELPITIANFAIASPYPGTEFHRQAEANGWLVKQAAWEDYDQNYSPVVDYGHLKPEDIYQALKTANREFFFRPKPLLRIAKEMKSWPMIKSLFGITLSYLKLFLGKETVQKKVRERAA